MHIIKIAGETISDRLLIAMALKGLPSIKSYKMFAAIGLSHRKTETRHILNLKLRCEISKRQINVAQLPIRAKM